MNDAFSSLNKAFDLDPDDLEAHRIMGAVSLLFEKDIEKAVFHHKKAIEMVPSDTFHLARYAILLCFLDEPNSGLVEIKKAIRINPFCSDLIHEAEGFCYYLLGDFKTAVSSFKKMQIDTWNTLFYLASCYMEMNQIEKAKNYIELARNMSSISIKQFLSTQLFVNDKQSSFLNNSLSSI